MRLLLPALAFAALSANPSVAQNRPDGVPPPTLEERVEELEEMHGSYASAAHPNVRATTHNHGSRGRQGGPGLAFLVLLYAVYLHGRIGDHKKELKALRAAQSGHDAT